jgi:hypothetical protein
VKQGIHIARGGRIIDLMEALKESMKTARRTDNRAEQKKRKKA